MKKIFAVIMVVVSMIVTVVPVVADESEMEIILTDITGQDTSVLKGETKIMVSVDGINNDASIVQIFLDFIGDFKYKSIKYLYNTDGITVVSPNAAVVNAENSIKMSMISTKSDIKLNGKTDLFVLTFSGIADEEMELRLNDLKSTYCICGAFNNAEINPQSNASVTAKGSSETNEGITAEVKLLMDKVTSFSAAYGNGNYSESGISLKITDEADSGSEYYTVLNNIPISKGGHRDTTSSSATFLISTELIANHTYTVELNGMGYISARKTGVNFENAVEFSNSDLIPGDVNGDGKINQEDYDGLNRVIENVSSDSNLESYATDFNRDGITDKYDLQIMKSVYTPIEPTSAPTIKPTSKPDNIGGGTGGSGGSGGNAPEPTSTPLAEPTLVPQATNDAPQSEIFTDLENHQWAKEAIYRLRNEGIINGTSDTTYSPANNIKRGDFILILVNMLSIDNEFAENFEDVHSDAYYYEAVGKAKAAGIAEGSGAEFMPESNITRQDLIALAYRAFLMKGYISEAQDLTSLDKFSDKDNISDYAKKAMASMVSAEIINGSDGNLNPRGNATRAETAVMCSALMDIMK